MKQYLALLRDILEHGSLSANRTDTATRSVFGRQLRFDLQEGFPLITTKNVSFKNIDTELKWMLSGSTNTKYLTDNGVHIWDEWADENGNLGPVYGKQWRNFSGVDQIENVMDLIVNAPNSRRMLVSAWNPQEVSHMALPPCHVLFQFYVKDGELSCQLYQRSADMFLGVPYNIASYSLLTYLIADYANLDVGEFVWVGGDCHIYENHIKQCATQILRDPYNLPQLIVSTNKLKSGADALLDSEIELVNYLHHPAIRGKVSV